MQLALVSPLPPLGSPAARVVADLIPHLVPHVRAETGVTLLPQGPEQCDELGDVPMRPCADLPRMLATGEVDLPVYFVADDLLHAHQIRFVRENPGLLVLLTPGIHRVVAALTEESGDMDGYRELLAEEHGDAAREWPERFLWRTDLDRLRSRLPLTGVLCRRSLGVLAEGDLATRLAGRHAEVPVEVVESFADAKSLAAQILAFAQQLVAAPREIPELPQPEWPSVEVVTVSYNSRRIIGPALDSLAAQDYPNLTCTVIDNASTDGTADFIRENYPSVNLVAETENRGFAGGNNVAFFRSKAKYLVLFNQDAVARRDFVTELVRVAERDANIAAVGGKMLMMRCPTILNSTGLIMNEGGFAVDRDIGLKDVDPSPVPQRVFGACGGAKLLRTDVVQELGGFDEAFFMYCEDVDLCWRMRLAGLEILYAPLAVVHHDWHGDLDAQTEEESVEVQEEKTIRRRMLGERNRIQCVMKNYAFFNMLRVMRRLRKNDKGRYRSLQHAIAAGVEVGPARVAFTAIKAANRWCMTHLFSIFRRRRAAQRFRRVGDEVIAEYIDPGVGEPQHVGDLSVVNDRHSAESSARLQMGVSDRRALGPGWHGLEPVEGEEFGLRWSKGRAWVYVDVAAPSTTLGLRVARGAVEPHLHVKVGSLPPVEVPVQSGDLEVFTLKLPKTVAPAANVEVELHCESFRPSELSDSADGRELGVRLAELWLE